MSYGTTILRNTRWFVLISVLLLGTVHSTQASTSTAINTWTKLPLDGWVSTLTSDPTTPTTIYAGVYQPVVDTNHSPGFFVSTDGGQLWQDSSTGIGDLDRSGIRVIAIDPTTPSNLYLAAYSTVYRSTNRGSTWQEVRDGLPTAPNTASCIASLTIAPTQPATVYLSYVSIFNDGCPSGLYTIQGNATTWQKRSTANEANRIAALSIHPNQPTTLYAGLQATQVSTSRFGGGVARSTDGGTTWQRLNTGLPEGVSVGRIVVSGANEKTIYAIADGGTVLRSTDWGNAWRNVTIPVPSGNILNLGIDQQANILVAQTTQGLFWKPVSATIWFSFNENISDVFSGIYIFTRSDSVQAFVSSQNGLYTRTIGRHYLPAIQATRS